MQAKGQRRGREEILDRKRGTTKEGKRTRE